jgi:hypothetical protein
MFVFTYLIFMFIFIRLNILTDLYVDSVYTYLADHDRLRPKQNGKMGKKIKSRTFLSIILCDGLSYDLKGFFRISLSCCRQMPKHFNFLMCGLFLP